MADNSVLAIAWRPHCLSQGCLTVLMAWRWASPRMNDPRGQVEARMPLKIEHWKPHTILLPYSIGQGNSKGSPKFKERKQRFPSLSLPPPPPRFPSLDRGVSREEGGM